MQSILCNTCFRSIYILHIGPDAQAQSVEGLEIGRGNCAAPPLVRRPMPYDASLSFSPITSPARLDPESTINWHGSLLFAVFPFVVVPKYIRYLLRRVLFCHRGQTQTLEFVVVARATSACELMLQLLFVYQVLQLQVFLCLFWARLLFFWYI